MTELEQFQAFVKCKAHDCAELWAVANKEYASDASITFNFYNIAEMMKENTNTPGISGYEVAAVYLMKHIYSIVRNHSTRESMEGRFTDAHNYLFIMEWLLRDPEMPFTPDAQAQDEIDELLAAAYERDHAEMAEANRNYLEYKMEGLREENKARFKARTGLKNHLEVHDATGGRGLPNAYLEVA